MSSRQIALRISFGMAILAVVAIASGCAMYDRMMTKSVDLSGANEVPPVATAAAGIATIVVKDDRSVSGKISYSGMTATAAHIHSGARGKNGPVIIGLVKASGNTFKTPDGAKFTAAQYAEYKAGKMYINVHSAAHKPGEIRGQLAP